MLVFYTSALMKRAHSHRCLPCVFFIYVPTKPGTYRASHICLCEYNTLLRSVKVLFTVCFGKILPHALKNMFSDAGVNRNRVPCALCSAGLSGSQVHLPLSKSSTERGKDQFLH